jgi:hypothetical protein
MEIKFTALRPTLCPGSCREWAGFLVTDIRGGKKPMFRGTYRVCSIVSAVMQLGSRMKPQQLVKMAAGALVTLALVTLGGRTLAEVKQIPMLSLVVLAFAFELALVTGVIFGAAAAWFANVYRSRLRTVTSVPGLTDRKEFKSYDTIRRPTLPLQGERSREIRQGAAPCN